MIYLDSAATTLQKPPEVLRAMRTAFSSFGGAGRGSHQASMNAANAIYDLRETACEMFGASSPEQVILTHNATHALNIAIKGLAKPGGHVLVSGFEHNAVMRPLKALESQNIRYTVVKTPLFDPEESLKNFWKMLSGDVSLVICTHASNVFGTVMPVAELSKMCRDRGVPMIIDASQTAGILPINMPELHGAVLCMPGHKALYGPQGTGLLILPKGMSLPPLIEGGTGSNSLQFDMPEELPDALEAGTLNAWGAIGLLEGMRFARARQKEIGLHERALMTELLGLLAGIRTVKCYSHPKHQIGVLSMTFGGIDVEQAASGLADAEIAVRAGLQCAALAHMTAGTYPAGTLRVSLSAFSTTGEIRTFVRRLKEILSKM
ncbi:MAG: aminotransferase class V-fold PLP-dependent enzyme [Oscillospiraceae bacterium]|nr:aminotransferase class V-fold PLP-dependent enzyme [Oscillospiraceae bacterium]